MNFKICSLNVRGLGDKVKRREVFNWLRDKKFSIIMLQEVHCIDKNIPIYLAEWGCEGLFSCHTSASAGVCIVFNNNINSQIQKTFCDPEGRFIIWDIKIEQFCRTLTMPQTMAILVSLNMFSSSSSFLSAKNSLSVETVT